MDGEEPPPEEISFLRGVTMHSALHRDKPGGGGGGNVL